AQPRETVAPLRWGHCENGYRPDELTELRQLVRTHRCVEEIVRVGERGELDDGVRRRQRVQTEALVVAPVAQHYDGPHGTGYVGERRVVERESALVPRRRDTL